MPIGAGDCMRAENGFGLEAGKAERHVSEIVGKTQRMHVKEIPLFLCPSNITTPFYFLNL